MVKGGIINLDNIQKIGIIIIQSLDKNDKETGRILSNGIIKYKTFQEESFSSEFKDISSKNELLTYLEELIERIEKEKFYFVLHFEVHGNEQGIVLKNGDGVLWNELFVYTRKINILFGGNLALGLAMCYGGAILSSIQPNDRAPFKFFIGAFREINSDEIIRGFEQFYNYFLFSFSPIKSLDFMNIELNPDEKTFHFMNDELIFDAICNPDRDPTGFAKVVDEHFYNSPHIKREAIEKNIRDFLAVTHLKYRDFFCFNDIKA